MTTILLALGRTARAGGVAPSVPTELLPLAGRPLLQRAVEGLADAGERDLVVVLQNQPERFSTLLEDGERWGVRIDYRRCPEGRDAASFAASLLAESGASRVVDPLAPGALTVVAAPAAAAGDAAPGGALDLPSYLESVRQALSGTMPGFVPSGRELSPGIRVSHHVRIHPTARLVAPVYLGDGVEVLAGATVGPFASVERGAVVGRGTTVHRSVLLPWTIVGEHLDILDMIVEGATFFKPAADSAYVSGDPALSTSRK